MTESPSTQPPSPTSQPSDSTWPAVPAQRGAYYIMQDPFHKDGGQLAIMSLDTFRDYGTSLEAFRQTCQKQDKRIHELLGAQQALARQLADAKDRLDALRDVRRREQRAEMEKGLILPGDSRGFSTKTR